MMRTVAGLRGLAVSALALGLMVASVGCDDGGDSATPDASMSGAGGEGGAGGAGGAGGEGGAGGAGGAAWSDLDFQARQGFMAQTVMPAMQPLFAAYDARFADAFTCNTCHGSDLVEFAMPADIPALSGAELSTFTFEGEGRQAIANQMATEIVPKMAELLGEEPYDPATETGTFGCFSCHAIE